MGIRTVKRQSPPSTDSRVAQLGSRVTALERVQGSAGGGGDGIQFNSGTYGPDNVGDWLLVETTDSVGTPDGNHAVEFALGRHNFGIHPRDGISVSLNPILDVYGINDDATSALALTLDTGASGSGITGMTMNLFGGGGGGVSGAEWYLQGGGGGAMTGLTLGIDNSGSAATVGMDMNIAAATSDAKGIDLVMDSRSPVGISLGVASHAGSATGATGLLAEIGGDGGSTVVKAISLEAYGGGTNYAIYVAGGLCRLNLPTSAGPTGTLWNDSGTVKVA